MDCFLKTRASNVARNEVDYLGGIDWMSVRKMYFVELHSSRCGYRVGFWICQHLIFECNYRRWTKHDFSTIVRSKYRGNQILGDIFRFLLIICVSGHRRLPIVFVFQQVSVVIITIFRALVLSADVKPENSFYARLYTNVSSFETLKS